MPMYNLIELRDNYVVVSLWQYHKDVPDDNITDSKSFKFKARIARRTPPDSNKKHIEIAVL